MYSGFQLAYLIILFLVASFSIIVYVRKGKKQQEFLYIYLGVSFALEFLMYSVQKYYTSTTGFGLLYNIYILFCASFFLVYFNRNQSIALKKLNTFVFTIFSTIYLVFIVENYREVNQVIGISFSLVYILYSLFWFYSKLKYPDMESIMNDPKFWVSFGLLFWGVFFILRIIPRYLFNEVDSGVLIISQTFFFIINIFFYSLFFISLIKYNKR